MNQAVEWFGHALETFQELDYLGTAPDPVPQYSDAELLSIIRDFWGQGYSVGSTLAHMTLLGQAINPFEIKSVFDELDHQLELNTMRQVANYEHD